MPSINMEWLFQRELQLRSDAADGTIGHMGPPGESDTTDGIADTTRSSTEAEGSSGVCTAKRSTLIRIHWKRKEGLGEKG